VNNVVNLVVLHETSVFLLITYIKTSVVAREIDFLVPEIGGNDGTSWANLFADGLDKRDTNLTIGTCYKDFLASLHCSKISKLFSNIRWE